MKRMSSFLALAIMITVIATVYSGTGVSAAVGAPETLPVNGTNILVNGDAVAFRVSEATAGNDLNGDGDTSDFVVHIHEQIANAGTTTNTGLAATILQLGDRFLWLSVSESQMGADINGGGDTTDNIVQTIDRETGVVRNSNLPLAYSSDRYNPPIVFAGQTGYFSVSERGAGVDLNGDTDTLDNVVHHWRPTGDLIVNTGHATFRLMSDDTYVAYSISEFAQGVSLNPDGDLDDQFLAFTEVDGVIQITDYPVRGAILRDGIILTHLSEDGNLLSDFNNDGDADDIILHFITLPDPTPTNLGHEGFSSNTDNGLIAFSVRESRTLTDLNGDGDTNDDVVFTHDGGTGQPVNSGLSGSLLRQSGQYALFGSHESQAGPSDLNGDGDVTDFVLHTIDITTGVLTNHQLVVDESGFMVGDELAHVFVNELGDGVDRNGDGDASDRRVLHLFNSQTGALTNLGLVTGFPSIEGFHVTFGVFESEQGAADLNGDGDALDEVFHYTTSDGGGGVINLGLAGHAPRLQKGLVIMPVSEWQQGNTDINGDGDDFDRVTHIFDPQGATITNLGGSDVFPQIGATQLAYSLNGALNVAQRFESETPPTSVADLAVSVTPSSQSITIDETASIEIEVVNLGPETAQNVTLEIDAGSDIANATATADFGTCAVTGNGATCSLGLMDPSGLATVTFATQFTSPGFTGITVDARHDGLDEGIGDESGTANVEVTDPPPAVPMVVDYSVSAPANATSTVGELFNLAVDVTNNSSDLGGTILVNALLPQGATVQSTTFDDGICPTGTGSAQNAELTQLCATTGIAAGETASMVLSMITSQPGTHPVMVSVTPILGDSSPVNNHVVSLINVVEPPPPPASDPVTGLPNFAAYATSDDGFAIGSLASVADGAIGSNGLIEISDEVSVGDVTAGGWVYLGPDSIAENVITGEELYIEESATAASVEEWAETEFLTLPQANAQPMWGGDFWRAGEDDPLLLEPGSYGVLESAFDDIIVFTSGDYDFAHLQVNDGSRLFIRIIDVDGDGVSDPAVIRAAENVEFGEFTSVEIIDGDASDVLFMVDGNLIWLGANGQFEGTYIAANGKVKLGYESTLTGSAYGNHIWLKDASNLTHLPYAHAIEEFSANEGGVFEDPWDEEWEEEPEEEPVVGEGVTA